MSTTAGIRVAIDTSTKRAGVCVANKSGQAREFTWLSEHNHCRELLPNLERLLKAMDADFKDVRLIAVALGPGRFSAVRVGIATAIGLSMPFDSKVVGVPTYTIESEPYWSETDTLYVLLPGGRSEIAWFKLERGVEQPTDSGFCAPNELARQLPSNAIICGECAPMVEPYMGNLKLAGGRHSERSPLKLLKIAELKLARQSDFPPLRPIYAKQPTISKPKVEYAF